MHDYVTNTFLLVGSLVRRKQLFCFVQGQGQKSEQKHTTKSIDEFHNHSPLLTMVMHNKVLNEDVYSKVLLNHQKSYSGTISVYLVESV